MRRFIFSFENPGVPEKAVISVGDANLILQMSVFHPTITHAHGCYLDKEESSIIITAPEGEAGEATEHFLVHLCALRGQQCIMCVNSRGEAGLLDCQNGSRHYLGILTAVPESEARTAPGWTEIDGQFFIVKESTPFVIAHDIPVERKT